MEITTIDKFLDLYYDNYFNKSEGYLDLRDDKKDKKPIETVKSLMNIYNMGFTVITTDPEGNTQIYFKFHDGSNGKYCSIKNSLYNSYQLLDELDNEESVAWTQILDIFIDNPDDVYDFLVTVVIKQ